MLREMIAARENNTASHGVSNSQLTLRKMPPREFLLTKADELRQPDTDLRTSGAPSGQQVMDNFIDYRA